VHLACDHSVQYLQQPEAVFAEIYRVLKPGGVAIMTFSNRMFYEKAVAAWRDTDSGYARVQARGLVWGE
jgi:ubiquinone/menaquinone biosynthesis C-methylase UbiE